MEKEYICTIDQAKFNSSDDLIQHLLNKYSLTQDQGDDTSKFFKKLKDAFPTAFINIATNEEETHINLIINECNADFDFVISKKDTNEMHYHINVFRGIDSAIQYYQEIMSEKDNLVEAIKKKFNANRVEVNHLFDDVGSSSINFSFYVDDKEYDGRYEFEGIEKCLKNLEGHFVTVIEGDITIDYRGLDGNTVYVDGVDIGVLMSRAKRLKVEITEFK